MPDSTLTYNIENGVHCADFIGRDQNIHYGFSAEDVERLIQKMLEMILAGAAFAPLQDGALKIEAEGQTLTFQPRAAHLLAGQRNERSYLLSLTLKKDYLEWATNFIPLKAELLERKTSGGVLDIPLAYLAVRQPPPGSGPEAQIVEEELKNIMEALDRHEVFIILGEPGCGKTTTLQKMAYDHALACLGGPGRKMPFFVRLSQQHTDAPFTFLEKTWAQHTGSSLADALEAGRVLLLLDGINELPSDESLPQRLSDWRLFAKEYGGLNQIVFSGREKDYTGHLDLPRVRVRALDEESIYAYMRRNQAEGLIDALQKASPDARRRIQDLAQNPLHLNMLVHYYRENQTSLDNRGVLFAWFANSLLAREKFFHPENDRGNLPIEVRSAALAQLAFAIQADKLGTVIPFARAQALIPPQIVFKGKTYAVEAEALFHFARGARVLDPNLEDEVRFQHQMLHEYFAALELLERFEIATDLTLLWRATRSIEEMPPTAVGDWDPLPEPPSSGWEVTTILACGLSRAPEKLIEAVRQANPALAARCLDEAGIEKPAAVTASARADLLADLYNPQMHLRARLQAGYLLGKIGDPRFEKKEIGGVQVIVPQMVAVPAGDYLIGSHKGEKDSYEDESPQHKIAVTAFSLGKWPVTNAEFACFIAGGGYENEIYWEGELAKRWLKGEDVAGGQLTTAMNNWKIIHALPDIRQTLLDTGNFSPEEAEYYAQIFGLDEDDYKAEISKSYEGKSRTGPAYWDNPERNNPSQPVVGITWFEARAYCAWLSVVTGKPYRLPTEVEWEAAARGSLPFGHDVENRTYPWGNDWDKEKANSLEGRVLKPSPVGAYACTGAVGPFEAEDQAGNVYNWTSSLYLPYPYDPSKSELAEAEGERVVRGGSWVNYSRYVRCAYRFRYVPVDFFNNFGCRVVSPRL
jgi:formylglycine-generating enzyme required for sulfatase activity